MREYGVAYRHEPQRLWHRPLRCSKLNAGRQSFSGPRPRSTTFRAMPGNHILIQAVADRADVVLIDEMADFSLEEASRLLGKPVIRFRHLDSDDMRQKLHEHVPRQATDRFD